MSDIDIVMHDTLRSLAAITTFAKEIDALLDYDFSGDVDGINYIKAMLTGILAITHSQSANLETILGDE